MLVDILKPNDFGPSGQSKEITAAWKAGDWIGSFNLWVVQSTPEGDYILYQKRPDSGWAPGLLDVAVGGHYELGETMRDGLREAREEIGRNYQFDDLTYLGKKLYLRDDGWKKLRYAVDVFITRDNTLLREYQIDKVELRGLYLCSIEELIKAHTHSGYSFWANGFAVEGDEYVENKIEVSAASFPFNWDSYHLKMALLAKRFIQNERRLIY